MREIESSRFHNAFRFHATHAFHATHGLHAARCFRLPTRFHELRRLRRAAVRAVGNIVITGLVLSSFNSRCSFNSVQAQEAKWQRVFTGEDSIIELNASSPRFEPGHVMRVEFRTTYSKPEKLSSTSAVRYKSRLEVVDFKLTERRYRLFETTILDPAGKTLNAYKATADDEWRVIKPSGVMEKLFNAVRLLPPFGTWKVISYRFAEARRNSSSTSQLNRATSQANSTTQPARDTPQPTRTTAQLGPGNTQLDKLIGMHVRLTSDQAVVGTKICSLPAYEHKHATKDELAQELGIQSTTLDGYLESITVNCSGSGWTPPQSLLIRRSGDEMLMLWDGVFLVLKKDREGSLDFGGTLRRRSG
jgi:hypothetical protein